MPLHSVGRKLKTIGGAPLRVGTEPVKNDRALFNACPPFSEWQITGAGAQITPEGHLHLPVLGAQAESPLIRVDGPNFLTLSAQAYTDNPSPYGPFNGAAAFLYGTIYYAADGVTRAYTNTPTPYSGNGRTSQFPKGKWSSRYPVAEGYTGWQIQAGPNVIFVKWTITADATYSSRPVWYRDPMCISAGNAYGPYAHYYRKGL